MSDVSMVLLMRSCDVGTGRFCSCLHVSSLTLSPTRSAEAEPQASVRCPLGGMDLRPLTFELPAKS